MMLVPSEIYPNAFLIWGIYPKNVDYCVNYLRRLSNIYYWELLRDYFSNHK